MRKMIIISAVVGNYTIPLCWARKEENVVNELRKRPIMFDLYQQELIWLEEVDFRESDCKNLIHMNTYFQMYDTPAY